MDPKEDQYRAAIAEAERIVERDGRRLSALAFRIDREEAPFEVMRWAHRYAEELPLLRKCPHGDLSRVHTIFGVEPNRAYCNEKCAEKRAGQLLRDARRCSSRECDFCHQHHEKVAPVVFSIAAVVVRAAMCAYCLAGVPAHNN